MSLLILTPVPEMFRKFSGNVPGMLLFHAQVPELFQERSYELLLERS